jgi:hypothetical protein
LEGADQDKVEAHSKQQDQVGRQDATAAAAAAAGEAQID